MIRIICLGDVVGDVGIRMVERFLPAFMKEKKVDFCLANGENTAGGLGVSKRGLKRLMSAGVDVFTSGNHVWDHQDIDRILKEDYPLVRPANYPADTPGVGYRILPIRSQHGEHRILITNLLGRLFLTKVECPFTTIDNLLEEQSGNYDFSILDFHAEATAEKVAMGYFLDGRVSIVVGTHTHVLTHDGQILPEGTAYLTDLGMSGSALSVIGVEVTPVIDHFLHRNFTPWRPAKGICRMTGIQVDLDPDSGRAVAIDYIVIEEK
jgi:hypothetical protein